MSRPLTRQELSPRHIRHTPEEYEDVAQWPHRTREVPSTQSGPGYGPGKVWAKTGQVTSIEPYEITVTKSDSQIRAKATLDGDEIGSATAEEDGPKAYYVSDSSVDPEHQRKGLATAMYDAIAAAIHPKELGMGDNRMSPEALRMWKGRLGLTDEWMIDRHLDGLYDAFGYLDEELGPDHTDEDVEQLARRNLGISPKKGARVAKIIRNAARSKKTSSSPISAVIAGHRPTTTIQAGTTNRLKKKTISITSQHIILDGWPAIVSSAKAGGINPPRIYMADLSETSDVARYVNGTQDSPIILIDPFKHADYAHEVLNSVMHELAHAVGEANDEDWEDEELAEERGREWGGTKQSSRVAKIIRNAQPGTLEVYAPDVVYHVGNLAGGRIAPSSSLEGAALSVSEHPESGQR